MGLGERLQALGWSAAPTGRAVCPACRTPAAGSRAGARFAGGPAAAALAVLAAAGACWAVAVQQAVAMGGMAPGPGSPAAFAAGWALMMAAMMLPSALPLVLAFARDSRRRRGWPAATVLLVASYLAVWLLLGLAGYALEGAVERLPPAGPGLGAAGLALAGLYALTPLQRWGQARCRCLCALHEPLPFNLQRGALVAGLRYGVSCVACSGGLMLAMLAIGMSNLAWVAVTAGLVLLYKAAPAAAGWPWLLAAAPVALAIPYVLTA